MRSPRLRGLKPRGEVRVGGGDVVQKVGRAECDRTVPVFTVVRSLKEEPDFVPAASPRVRRRPSSWPPAPASKYGYGSSRRTQQRDAPRPAQIRQVRAGVSDEGRNHAGSSRTPLQLTCRTRTIWQYWHVPALSGPLPPSPAPPGSDCPQLHRPAATGQRRRSLTSTRTTAPHGAPGKRSSPPTRWSDSTARSSVAPTSSRSSPTPTPSNDSPPPCSSKCTTNGSRSPADTYPRGTSQTAVVVVTWLHCRCSPSSFWIIAVFWWSSQACRGWWPRDC